MNRLLPVPLLLFASVVALLPRASLAHRSVSLPCLMAEAFITALAVVALVWLGRVALWPLEQL